MLNFTWRFTMECIRNAKTNKVSNSAFAEVEHLEAARILEIVAQKLRVKDFGGSIFDVNGNKIGYFYLEIDND